MIVCMDKEVKTHTQARCIQDMHISDELTISLGSYIVYINPCKPIPKPGNPLNMKLPRDCIAMAIRLCMCTKIQTNANLTKFLPHLIIERVLSIKAIRWYTTMLRDHTSNEWQCR